MSEVSERTNDFLHFLPQFGPTVARGIDSLDRGDTDSDISGEDAGSVFSEASYKEDGPSLDDIIPDPKDLIHPAKSIISNESGALIGLGLLEPVQVHQIQTFESTKQRQYPLSLHQEVPKGIAPPPTNPRDDEPSSTETPGDDILALIPDTRSKESTSQISTLGDYANPTPKNLPGDSPPPSRDMVENEASPLENSPATDMRLKILKSNTRTGISNDTPDSNPSGHASKFTKPQIEPVSDQRVSLPANETTSIPPQKADKDESRPSASSTKEQKLDPESFSELPPPSSDLEGFSPLHVAAGFREDSSPQPSNQTPTLNNNVDDKKPTSKPKGDDTLEYLSRGLSAGIDGSNQEKGDKSQISPATKNQTTSRIKSATSSWLPTSIPFSGFSRNSGAFSKIPPISLPLNGLSLFNLIGTTVLTDSSPEVSKQTSGILEGATESTQTTLEIEGPLDFPILPGSFPIISNVADTELPVVSESAIPLNSDINTIDPDGYNSNVWDPVFLSLISMILYIFTPGLELIDALLTPSSFIDTFYLFGSKVILETWGPALNILEVPVPNLEILMEDLDVPLAAARVMFLDIWVPFLNIFEFFITPAISLLTFFALPFAGLQKAIAFFGLLPSKFANIRSISWKELWTSATSLGWLSTKQLHRLVVSFPENIKKIATINFDFDNIFIMLMNTRHLYMYLYTYLLLLCWASELAHTQKTTIFNSSFHFYLSIIFPILLWFNIPIVLFFSANHFIYSAFRLTSNYVC
ncbi:hypothetical protein TWF694_010450 [Orbilia ellipsospora]|uniref:Uncharacterized protein n=1 Tax=Orbilia ellipsospora TaxID=2528407 RepID=A0AAV9XG66_9PEZI